MRKCTQGSGCHPSAPTPGKALYATERTGFQATRPSSLVRRLGAEPISRKPATNTALVAREDKPIGSRKLTEPTSLCIGLDGLSCSRVAPTFAVACVSRRRHCRSCLSLRLPPRLPRSGDERPGSAGSLMTGLPTVGGSCKGLLLAIARRTALADLLNRASCLRNAFMAAPKTRKAQTLLLRSSVNVASSDTFR